MQNQTEVISDYRNHSSSEPTEPQTIPTTEKSYSAALSQQHFPTKEQAILFTAIDGTPLQDYIFALGSKIKPKNIVFSSRIANNRICIYLSTQKPVDKILREHTFITLLPITIGYNSYREQSM